MEMVAPPFPSPPRQARLFVLTIAMVSIPVVAAAQIASQATFDVPLLAVCLIVCAAGSFYEVQAPGGFWLQPHLPAFVFAALLLPPLASALVAVAVFAPGGLKRREDPYRVAFNVANLALAGATAGAVAAAGRMGIDPADSVASLFAGTLALVATNHILVSIVSSLARDEGPGQALLAGARLASTRGLGLALDLALALTGASLAALWTSYPEALPLAAGPVALACAALWIPMLRHASRTDAKTGLFNYVHVRHLMAGAVAAAQRSEEPVSVLMVDLDHLRLVNNRHGHLTGDDQIAGVARILANHIEGRGSAGRFGGEEFCAVLPGLGGAAAAEIAEDVRAAVAARHLTGGADAPPAASVSIGIATFPEHGDDVDSILHAADMALYDAKLGGRNRVRMAPPREAGVLREAPGSVESLLDPAVDAPVPGPEPSAGRSGWLAPFAALLLAVTLVAVGFADTARVGSEPVFFVALLTCVVVLDAIRIDLFERLQTSPAALPILVLAIVFGPVGPVAGEALILGLRFARRSPRAQAAFDFGALSLAGVAAAAAYAAMAAANVDVVPAGLVAGAAYYAVNIPLVAVAVWIVRGTTPLANFREQLAWLLPHYTAFGLLAGVFVTVWNHIGFSVFVLFGVPTALLWVGERQYVARSRSGVEELRASHAELEQANAGLRRLLADNQALLQRLQTAYLSTITSLARTIEAKDPYTGGHTDRVSRLAGVLAAEMAFSSVELEAVEVGAAIHDIGKVGVPDATLLKAGPLSIEERQLIERHPETSSYIVAELDVPAIVKQMVRSHHERYDGAGYPDHLAGEEIPLAARILAVADALDAMTSDRPYRRAMSIEGALQAIDANTGSQFCPEVVAALHRCVSSKRFMSNRRHPMEAVA